MAFAGFVCIFLAIATGFTISSWLGFLRNESHESLPILMLGIGVDDMFVICNALDQSSLKDSTRDRFI